MRTTFTLKKLFFFYCNKIIYNSNTYSFMRSSQQLLNRIYCLHKMSVKSLNRVTVYWKWNYMQLNPLTIHSIAGFTGKKCEDRVCVFSPPSCRESRTSTDHYFSGGTRLDRYQLKRPAPRILFYWYDNPPRFWRKLRVPLSSETTAKNHQYTIDSSNAAPHAWRFCRINANPITL